MSLLRRFLPLILPAISLVWLFVDAPGPTWRETYFVLLMLLITIATRTLSWRTAVNGVSLGIGIAAPLMVLVGWLLARAGFDIAESGVGSWGVVPIVEEALKLGLVWGAASLFTRRTRLTFNPSDWLLIGCAVGAGFAMVENAQLVRHDPGVLRDMARQYGPSWLVPGAWGTAGFVGHAAATGLAAAGIGLSQSMRRRAATSGASGTRGLVVMILPVAWITLEHVLANLHVNTGSDATFLLGNGRVTPWLFLAMTAVIVYTDQDLARRALAHSRTLRQRRAVAREALVGTRVAKHRPLAERLRVAAGEVRLVNAAGWAMLERLVSGEMNK